MRTIFLLIISTMLLSFTGKETQTDLQKEGLKGKVKSISNLGDQTTVYNYNESGNKIEYFYYGDDKTLQESATFKYNSMGQITEKTSLGLYNSWTSSIIYKYDAKGNKIEETDSSASKVHDVKLKYIYDKKGDLTEERFGPGTLAFSYSYKYDEKGNLVECDKMFADGKLYIKNIYKVDLDGNKIEWQEADSLYHTVKTTKYNSKGQAIEHNSFTKGNFDGKSVTSYDENGNPIKYINYKADGTVSSTRNYTYVYDIAGNWTKMVTVLTRKESQTFETSRVIEYY